MGTNNRPLTPIDENQVQQPVAIPRPIPAFYQLPSKIPCSDLLNDDRRKDYLEICIPLYEASITGDWRKAKIILDAHPDVIRFSITENHETALHIAASAKSTQFVKNLVNLMTAEDLELQNKNSNTALCLAAAAGNVDIAKIMVDKNRTLLTIPGSKNMMPLYMAALFGNHDMVKYLYDNSQKLQDDGWTSQNRGWLLLKCVESDLFDVALDIVNDRPELASSGAILEVLARKPYAFEGITPHRMWRIINSIFSVFHLKVGPAEKDSPALQLLRIIWRKIVQKSKSEIDTIIRGPPQMKEGRLCHPSRVLFVAAEMGNTQFVVELIRQYPDLIWKLNDNNQSIFHIAVSHRHESIYNLLYEIGSMKDLITPLKDPRDNNMLHLVGDIDNAKRKRIQIVSGVALQMQRELLWFQEVESMIPPTYRERKNKDGLTPHELFTKQHKDMVSLGEKWMKGTASQCMVVATLIATIVFAAAFTVPGGYNQDDGIPMFLTKRPFIVFVISDAISLFSSSASIVMFLSILTSRYAERDFLESIPKKLMMGLATLFISILTMMVAFSVSFFVLYLKGLRWVPIVISSLAVVPVILFARLQFPLLADVFRSTYGSRYLFKPRKHMLYYQNPKF